jgi:hypothetical protein
MAKRRTPRPAPPARRRASGGGTTRPTTSRGTRAASSRSAKPRPAPARKTSPSRPGAPASSKSTKPAIRKVTRQKPAPKASKKRATPKARPAPAATSARQQAGPRGAGTLREQVERARRLREETVRTPPSSLTHSPHASAARSGRAELREALANHTESSPALTGGDVDADWESAYASGDEAPGGDMPTPDQGVVEEIGTALGIEYQDDEELKGAVKLEERDHHRWELDPASAEDYGERSKPDRRKR